MMVLTLKDSNDHSLPSSRCISAPIADVSVSRLNELEPRLEGRRGHAGSYRKRTFYPGPGFRSRPASLVGESSKYRADGDRSRHSRQRADRHLYLRIQAD